MKTSVETVSGTEKRVRVEIPADEVTKRIEEGYVEVRRMVPIRGFRKGKAPLSMVKRLFKDTVEGDVAEHLVKESLAEAVKENSLKVLSFPKIDGDKLTEGKEFAFSATFEVLPDIEPKDYRKIPVVKEPVSVGDGDVEASLERLRESFAEYHAVEDRGAGDADLVDVTYTAAAVEEHLAKDEAGSLLIGSGYPLGSEVEEKLKGARAGDEKKFDVAFPGDFADRKYAGKTVSFVVKVNAVREKKLPALDDEFVKNFGDIKDLAELRGRLRERLRAEAEERSKRLAEEELRKGLLERNAFDVPTTLVDRQIMAMIEDTAKRLHSQGVDLKKVDLDFEKMRERFAPSAERTVRVSLILEAIARKENLDVPFSEIEAEMKEIAAGARMEYEKVREMYSDEERMDGLRNRLMERKAMDFLMAQAETKEGVAE